tara:strand:- start:36 stop:680 length:645 start_codon:yes stop_codon:yes gene_type:complete
MAETLTINETPADQPELNADEQESLAVAEANEGGQQQLFAGKFQDTQSLEQAYLELQKKLGSSSNEAQDFEEVEQEEVSEDTEEESFEESADILSEDQANQLFDMIGGEQVYQDMISWAGQALNPAEVEMYDSVMAKGDPSSVFFAVQALNNKYTDAVGADGQLLTGNRTASQQDAQFRSQQELVAAMNDPRYDNDPAFRDDVMRKLTNSDLDF